MAILYRWLRLTALMWLVLSTWSQMIDLDCALNDPLHCQTLLESDDNTFARISAAQPLWVLPPARPTPQPVNLPFEGLQPPAARPLNPPPVGPNPSLPAHCIRPPPVALS